MFPQLDRELRFGYQKNGSLVVATSTKEMEVLDDLLARGKINGVQNLRIIDKNELFEMEPALNPDCIAALLSDIDSLPSGSISSSIIVSSSSRAAERVHNFISTLNVTLVLTLECA